MSAKSKKPSRILLVIALLLIVGVIGTRQFFLEPPPPNLITAPVTQSNIEDAVLANGTLQAFKQVSVGAQVSGQVKSLKVKLGDTVAKGQLVAEIDSLAQQNTLQSAEAAMASMLAQWRSAQATLAQNELTLKRQQQMRSADASSQADLEAAEASVKTGRASVDSLKAQAEEARLSVAKARVNLDYTRITSPIDGQVVAVITEEGTTVNANQSTPTIIIVAQVDQMTVKASISEADITSTRAGQRVHFTILGEPDRRYEAVLRTIEPATDSISNTGTSTGSSASSSNSSNSTTTSATAIYYNGMFDVPNPERKLRISMTAMVSIVRGEARNTLTIPVGALSARAPDGSYTVGVVGSDGRPHQRRVHVGINNNVNAQILDGLAMGEQVVIGNAATTPSSRPFGGRPPMGGPPPGGL